MAEKIQKGWLRMRKVAELMELPIKCARRRIRKHEQAYGVTLLRFSSPGSTRGGRLEVNVALLAKIESGDLEHQGAIEAAMQDIQTKLQAVKIEIRSARKRLDQIEGQIGGRQPSEAS